MSLNLPSQQLIAGQALSQKIVHQNKRSRKILVACMVGATIFGGLHGCTTTDPNTGERKVSNTAKDAGIGAAAGAVLGAVVSSKHDRGRGAATGAVLGGAIGGVIGHRADKQEKELREKLDKSGVEVQRDGNTINLVVPDNISFATGSAQLTPNFYESMSKVATSLKEFPDSSVQIVGHTDSTGSASFNQTLSVNRANAVVVYLTAQGIPQQRLQAVGMGPSQPVGDNKTVEGRAQNRRVEIKIIPHEPPAEAAPQG
jgi:outer membrane protein OmpA-like peptidoglycan-associated protein